MFDNKRLDYIEERLTKITAGLDDKIGQLKRDINYESKERLELARYFYRLVYHLGLEIQPVPATAETFEFRKRSERVEDTNV